MASRPDLSLSEPVVLQHFSLGLCPVATTFLNSASGGSFSHLTPSAARVILDRILEDTPYTGVYDELPDEEEDQPEPESEEPVQLQSKSISSSIPSIPEAHYEPQPYPSPAYYDSLYTTPYDFDDDLFEDIGSITNFPRERRVEPIDQAPDKEELEYQREYLGRLSAIMSREWLDEAEASTEVVKMPGKTRRIYCEILGIDAEIGYDPSLGINIISSSMVHDQLPGVPWLFSQKRLQFTSGRILDCLGILWVTPVKINSPELFMDFHIFDLPSDTIHSIFIGRPIQKILEKAPTNQLVELRIGNELIDVSYSQSLNTPLEADPDPDPLEEVRSAHLLDLE